ncbi:MAG: hypothetical protein ACO4CH_03600 [Saprospiraceae bacterium]
MKIAIGAGLFAEWNMEIYAGHHWTNDQSLERVAEGGGGNTNRQKDVSNENANRR